MARMGNRRRATRGEPSALLIRRQTGLSRGVKGILVTGIIVTTLVTSVAAASAQNIFEALFGRLWSSHSNANADHQRSSCAKSRKNSGAGATNVDKGAINTGA